jgi:serine/threonine protein kinase
VFTATGSYADIFKCNWNSKIIALKQLRFKPKEDDLKRFKLEAALSFYLKHPNIVLVYGLSILENDNIGIVMEWADQGSLSENMNTMTSEEKVKVSLCISNGLAFLHSEKIAHRDLKPENVLLFKNRSTAKLADFGTSKAVQTMTSSSGIVGTPKYTAPELFGQGNVVMFPYLLLFYGNEVRGVGGVRGYAIEPPSITKPTFLLNM